VGARPIVWVHCFGSSPCSWLAKRADEGVSFVDRVQMDTQMDLDASRVNVPPAPAPIPGRSVSTPTMTSPFQKQRQYRSAFVYDINMMMHRPANGTVHPEQPARIARIFDSLKTSGCLADMGQLNGRLVTKQEAMLVHSEEHWNKVEALQSKYLTRS
jgi:histone deacetylase 6